MARLRSTRSPSPPPRAAARASRSAGDAVKKQITSRSPSRGTGPKRRRAARGASAGVEHGAVDRVLATNLILGIGWIIIAST